MLLSLLTARAQASALEIRGEQRVLALASTGAGFLPIVAGDLLIRNG